MGKSADVNLPSFEKCQAIAIDLDGTLLDSKSNLSARSRTALEQCILLGLPTIIATSRAERSVRRLVGNELADRCSLVMMNGAVAKGTTPLSGSVKETIPSAIAGKIVALVLKKEPGVSVAIELDGFEFGYNMKPDPKVLWEVNSATPDMVLTLEEAISRAPGKIAVNGLGRDLSVVAQEIRRQFSDSVSVFPANDMRFLNIPSFRASKPKALQYLLNSRQISVNEVVAFGDDLPDVEMLEICGIPVAVANAAPEVLACAKYQTLTNDEDGVAIVLEKIIAARNQRD